MTFDDFRTRQNQLYAAAADAGDRLRAYPKGPLGLTLDEVKATDAWRADWAAAQKVNAELQQFNRRWLKVFRHELAAHRAARLTATPKNQEA